MIFLAIRMDYILGDFLVRSRLLNFFQEQLASDNNEQPVLDVGRAG
jgi:hypothetical protein